MVTTETIEVLVRVPREAYDAALACSTPKRREFLGDVVVEACRDHQRAGRPDYLPTKSRAGLYTAVKQLTHRIPEYDDAAHAAEAVLLCHLLPRTKP